MSSTQSDLYDIIFAGGGTAGCVAAGRLAEADPSLKILILEAGSHTREVEAHIQPARYVSNFREHGEKFTYHVGKPSKSLNGRGPVVCSGRVLGGGSSINAMVYTRAAASDYDDWEKNYGNKGWASKDLIPLVNKAETYQPQVNDPSVHGKSGPIKVSIAASQVTIAEQFLAVSKVYDKERGQTDDFNDFHNINLYARWPRYIDGESGRRSDIPHHYIYTQDHNENLTILDRQRVIRVIFEGTKAVGVEYVGDKIAKAKGVQESSVALASYLVILSAGAFGSPAILERSGIGASELLKKSDIKHIVDLPGVGEHYMDHNLMFTPFCGADDVDSMDDIFYGKQDDVAAHAAQWHDGGKGLMSHNGTDAGIKLRPNAEELEELGPVFETRWKTYFANAPDKPVVIAGPLACLTARNLNAPPGKYFSMQYFSCYPLSTGNVHITAGLDPYAPLDFHPGYLDDPADLGVLRWAYKWTREFSRRMDTFRGELAGGHPEFPAGSKAAAKTATLGPDPIDLPKIVYTAEDDAAIDDYHRDKVGTTWHSIGTCAMKPREQGGVVDPRLNVYGVQNLKVADLSIAPDNVGANTYNTAIAVGEKAALIIAEDLYRHKLS